VFLLLQRAQAGDVRARAGDVQWLGPIGLFSLVVTLGLFAYELRGNAAMPQTGSTGAALEGQLKLSPELGALPGETSKGPGEHARPAGSRVDHLPRDRIRLDLGERLRVGWWRKASDAWGLLVADGATLVVAWIRLSLWLGRSATGQTAHQ
jgi:hypothetical protein